MCLNLDGTKFQNVVVVVVDVTCSVFGAAVILVPRPFETGGLIVLVQVRLQREALVTPFAGVVLEGRVCLHMGAEVGSVGESFATVGAGKGLLPRV